MSKRFMFLLFATALVAVPAHAEFWSISDLDMVYDKQEDVSPPVYLLEGFTFPDYDIPGSLLVVGESTGVVNVNDEAGRQDITLADNFDLNDFAPRNGANPPEIRTVNFGGSPTWQDTNGDQFDFFIFEAGGNDEFALQAILPGGVLGQKIVVPASQWDDLGGEPEPDLQRSPGPNNNQQINGIAWKITDMVDENGDPLTNESVIEGLIFTSPGMDPSCICAVKGTPFASGPQPADGAILDTVCPILQWSPGLGATSEEVYFSTILEEVENTDASALLTTTTQAVANVCTPGTPYADGLAPATYYWRVVSTTDAQETKAGPVWSFMVLSGEATNPMPADGGLYVPLDTNFSWTAGADALIHYVYLETDLDALANATQADAVPASEPTYDPGALEPDTTYYWRVDEFTAAGVTTPGQVWTFSTPPTGEGGLKAEYFEGVEPLIGVPVVTRTDPQIEFDWANEAPDPALDQAQFSARWKGEISIPADGTYTFITRSNDGSRIFVNDQLVVEDWGTHAARDTAGSITLEAGAYPIAVEYFQEGGGAEMSISWESELIPRQIVPSVALAPVVRARLLFPADEATNVNQAPLLQWEEAAPEAEHEVYLGTDEAAVEAADTGATDVFMGRQAETFYFASLEPDTTYYWRIDEVIAGDPESPIKGHVWSFTTAPYPVVDDFENYTDNEGQRIFDVWLDGWEDNTNGSIVGNETPPYAEQDIVHSGQQAMNMMYDNSEAAVSTATRTFDAVQDWTGEDVLTVWYRGVAPLGDFAYDAEQQEYTITGSGNGIDGNSDGFRFVYATLTGDGSITARLESMGRPADWAVAGVMIRDTLEPGSPMAISGVRATGQAFVRWRDLPDAPLSGTVEEPPFPATIVIPHYVRLTRNGDTFQAAHSSDGVNWDDTGDSFSVGMGQEVHIGLAVSADVGAGSTATNTAVFTNVDTTGTVSPAGPFLGLQDIGITGNSPEPFYVIVDDSAGGQAIITHPDGPDAIVTNTWTAWPIELADIAAEGVNLNRVSGLTVGVGNPGGAASDATGTLYIDDIRLMSVSDLPPVVSVAPPTAVEITGDDGMVLSINELDVANLALATTTSDFEKHADHPAVDADDFDLSTYASLDEAGVVTMTFPAPVSTIFIIERGANDEGLIQPVDAAGEPVGGVQTFAKSDWFKPGISINGQDAGAIAITAEVPISGIQILPLPDGVTGLDPASVSGITAE